jgi:8-oxo-dGTP pyrophosphatase MutT (NUDIX family)
MATRLQTGVIPYRIVDGKVQLMLISTKAGNWVFPKGGKGSKRGAKDNAAKEAMEEAGIIGKVYKKLGKYEYVKEGEKNIVTLYLMRVEKTLKVYDEPWRKRKWFGKNKAMTIAKDKLKPLIKIAVKHLRSNYDL